jgi:hypothetical protein
MRRGFLGLTVSGYRPRRVVLHSVGRAVALESGKCLISRPIDEGLLSATDVENLAAGDEPRQRIYPRIPPCECGFSPCGFVTSQKNGVSALGLQRVLGLGSYETAGRWSALAGIASPARHARATRIISNAGNGLCR